MFQSLIRDLQAKWRGDRLRKGSYEYTSVDTESWRFVLVKGEQDDYYHFIVFIRHPDEPVSIEGDLTEDEQIMKDIMDEMHAGWTMIGMDLVERLEDVDPSAIILSRISNR